MTGNNVMQLEMTGSDPEVTSFHRKWPGEGCRRPKTPALVAFQLLPGCNSQVVVASLKVISHGLVTASDLEVSSIHRKWPGEGCRRPKTRSLGAFQPYWAVAHRRWQSRDRK